MLWCAVACMSPPLGVVCHCHEGTQMGTDAHAALYCHSLFFNLRKLTLHSVPVFLPALQPVATQVHELNVYGSRLHGSADRFLTKGWAALTSLSLAHTHMDHATIIAALELPMLEDTYICWVTGHRGGALQLDQLTGSCPHVSRMDFQLGEGCWQATKARRHSCSLLNLKRLADLQVMSWSLQANVDLDLHPSLTQLRFQGYQSGGNNSVDFLWALLEAVKCAGRGAQLHKLICKCAEAHLRPAQWGASLDEQHRRLGGQLSSLRELVILSACEQPLRAVGAVASAAASPTRLEIIVQNHSLPCVEVSPICSASLESIRVEWDLTSLPKQPPQLLLTLLPGCTRLQEVVVVVRNMGRPIEGAAVKIRCHCCSQRCIVPAMGYASFYSKEPKKMKAGAATDVIVRFVHMPPSEQGVQDCTLLYACHAAGPKQAPLWGCDLMPGIL